MPGFLVIGPQKSGSTALHSFLQLHPNIVSSHPSRDTFEEVQFFSIAVNYKRGVDWYLEFFPAANESVTLFEKSATYFDVEHVPLRVNRLLPRADIVVILIDPGERAYSWYQHMRAHNDPTALMYTFHDIITAGADSPRPVLSLQSRCLEPGKYVTHLEKWVTQVTARRLIIVDGDQLKNDPVTVMNNLQSSLNIQTFFDYSNNLFFDKSKGFYCMKVRGKKKCLGKGKGRAYPPMNQTSVEWLSKYYKKFNENLKELLLKYGYTLPEWLTSELSLRS